MPPFQTSVRSTIAALLLGVAACSSPNEGSTTEVGDSSMQAVNGDTSPGGAQGDGGGTTRDTGKPAPSGAACTAIAGLAVTSTSSATIALSWAGAPGVAIQVARETYCATDSYVTLASLPAGATSYTDNTVQADWVYWYKITATDVTSDMSASAAIATQANTVPADGCSGGATHRPSGVAASACTMGTVDGGTSPTGTDGGGSQPYDPPPIPPSSICTTLSSGASQSTIQGALNSCGSGKTVMLSAGTYGPITSTVTIPCGVSISGPAVPYSQRHNQTAVINGTVGEGPGFQTTAGCTVPQTIQDVEWNGGQPNPNGGQFLHMVSGSQNFSVRNSYMHGNNCGAYCGDRNAGLVYIDNTGTLPANSNVTVEWSIFSAPGDCAAAIVESNNSNTEGGGGSCVGVEMGGYLEDITVSNNRFQVGDDELKVYEMYEASGPGECNNCVFNYNDFQQYDRIAIETQANWGGPSSPTLMYIQYNSFHNLLNPHQQDFDISMANGCAYGFNTSGMIDCINHMDYNTTVATTPAVGCGDVGYEFWGGIGSTANGNFWSGTYQCVTIVYAPSGQFTANNNTAYVGGSSNTCGINNMSSEDGPNFSPSCSGNVSGSSSGTITSVAPVLSLSGSTVTISNTNVSAPNGSNPGRDSNTTFWCTTDGSTPSPGGSGSAPYWAGAASQTAGTIATTGSGTVKCIGMWGAPNQPYAYDSGYGYIPSAVVSIDY
jgi:hypothetical protein